MQVTEHTLFQWKKKFQELGTPNIPNLRELRDENQRDIPRVADLSLAKIIL